MGKPFLCRCGSGEPAYAIHDSDASYLGYGCHLCEDDRRAQHRRDLHYAAQAARAAPAAPSRKGGPP
jgi:hypothetical protein